MFLQNNIKHQLVPIFKEKSLDLQNLFRYCIMPCIVFAYFIHVCIYHLDTNVTKSPFFISKLCFEVDEFFSGSTDWKSIAFVEFEHSPEMKENKKSHTKKTVSGFMSFNKKNSVIFLALLHLLEVMNQLYYTTSWRTSNYFYR